MKTHSKLIMLTVALALPLFAAAQEQGKEMSIDEYAEKEADRYTAMLNLEDWQTFYVDSTLKHDWGALKAETDKMMKEKVSNNTLYENVSDKWEEQIDLTFRRIFNDEQWAKYLKNGAAKKQKARQKRMAAAAGGTVTKKK